jgi:hypothetical protein
MSDLLTLPRLGETMEEGRVTGWMVAPGAQFRRGDTLLEVETDKTVVEVPALRDGTLGEILAAVGDMVRVGAPLARLEMQIALPILFERCPGLALADTPRYADIYHFHGLEALRVSH